MERPNVERPIFRNFKISNIILRKMSSIFLFVLIIQTLKIYDNSANWKCLEFLIVLEFPNFFKLIIFKIEQF